MPESLRAPTKVVVFQCPCGTLMRSRSPRGERGIDTASYVTSTSGVVVDLTAQLTWDAATW